MVSGANVCDELQGLDLNFPALILSRVFFLRYVFTLLYLLSLKVFGAIFLFIVHLQWVLSWLF